MFKYGNSRFKIKALYCLCVEQWNYWVSAQKGASELDRYKTVSTKVSNMK